MGHSNRAHLRRTGDYEDAVRVLRLARQVSRWANGQTHPTIIRMEHQRYGILDDLVEELDAADEYGVRVWGWQIKRNTEETKEDVLRKVIAQLKANPELGAVVITRDPTSVRGLGSLPRLGALARRLSAPGVVPNEVEDNSSKGDNDRLKFIREEIGDEADVADAIQLLRRLRTESLGSRDRILEEAETRLRTAFMQPDVALGRLQSYLPGARDPAVEVTPEVLLKQLQGVEMLRHLRAGDASQPGPRRLRPSLRAHARDVLLEKALVSGTDGTHPPLPRLVALLDGERGPSGNETSAPPTMSLLDAIELNRRVLLLGDMGEGKTTAAASLTLELCDSADGPIPLLISGAYFADGQAPQTAESLLQACSRYLATEVDGRDLSGVDIRAMLQGGTKLLLILDSLDEAGLTNSSRLLRAASAAVRSHHDLGVLITARPSETRLPAHATWSRVGLQSLSAGQRRELLARADGETTDPAIARSRAAAVDARLQRSPALRPFAGTPMVTLMVGNVSEVENSDTIGDLIRCFVFLRLGGWDEESGGAGPSEGVRRQLPDLVSRVRILASLGEAMAGQSLADDQALDVLTRHLSDSGRSEAVEVLDYLRQSGLVARSGSRVHIPLVSISQWLRGVQFGQAGVAGDPTPIDGDQWREIAFAAGELRRLGQVNAARVWLTSALEAILASHLVPGAAMVVVEAGDEALARHFVAKLAELGDRPLWVYEEDRGESSNAIAGALALADEEGFRWFFDAYLEPRNPYLLAGIAIIDAIFEMWCLRCKGSLTEEQKDRLDRMRLALMGTQSHARLRRLPPLAVVMPERLPAPVVVQHLVDYLGNTSLEFLARQQLQEHIERSPADVSAACLRAAAKGYEAALNASMLWLELNPNSFHTAVADAVLGARQRVLQSDQVWAAAIATLRSRVGEERFVRFLRWSLIVGGAPATGAAFALADLGENRLRVLGDSVLNGLHGGVNCDGAPRLARDLMEAAPSSRLSWLVARFADSRSTFTGAHAGWWRLLLTELDRRPDAGPKAFEKCLRYSAGFVIPRHQDLRIRLGRLIGNEASPYRTIVERALRSTSVRHRQAAAMILVAALERPPHDALLEVLRAFGGRQLGNSWEWEEFLLGLSLQEHCDFLLENLGRLHPSGQAVARLVVRVQRGSLPDEQERALILDVLAGRISLIERGQLRVEILSSSVAHHVCSSELEARGPLSTGAAEALLRHHAAELSQSQRATTAIASTSAGYWRFSRIATEYQASRTDGDYAELLRVAAQKYDPSQSSLLAMLLDDHDATQWEPVLARLFLDGSHREGEEPADFLLRGAYTDHTKEAIGAAALRVLERAINNPGLRRDGILWLALLADEHGASAGDHIDALAGSVGGSYSAAAPALRARARTLPPYTFRPGNSRPHMVDAFSCSTADWPAAEKSADTLRQVVAPDGSFDSGMRNALLAHVLSTPVDDSLELDRSASDTARWALVQGCLDWLEGEDPRPEVIASGHPDLFLRARGGNQLDGLMDWWCRSHWDAIRAVDRIREEVVESLRRDVLASTSDVCAAGAEVLRLRGELLVDEVEPVVGGLGQPSLWREKLIAGVVAWVAADLGPTTADLVRDSIDRQVVAMDAFDEDDVRYDDADVALGLAFCAWRLGTHEPEATQRVFLRGLTALTRRGRRTEHTATDVLETIAPLVEQVDRTLVSDALRHGVETGTPEIRAVSLMFSAGLASSTLGET